MSALTTGEIKRLETHAAYCRRTGKEKKGAAMADAMNALRSGDKIAAFQVELLEHEVGVLRHVARRTLAVALEGLIEEVRP